MKLIDNAERVFKRAWSIRIVLLIAVLDGANTAVPFFTDEPPLPRVWMTVITVVLSLAACGARLVSQRDVPEKSV